MSFSPPALLGAYRRELSLPDEVELYADPGRALYRALGFGRASVARVWLDPRVWVRYASLLARGRRPRPPGEDTLQLGGDAVLDARGEVRWTYASRGPEDRPGLAEIRAAVARAQLPR